MKPSINRFLAASIISVFALSSSSVFGVDRIKTGVSGNLELAGSWGVAAPGTGDFATWDSTSILTGAGNTLGSNVSWGGIKVTNISGALSIGNSAANTLGITLGAGGIDMSSAAQNVTITSAITLGSSQTWTVNGGKSLTLAALNAGRSVNSVAGQTLTLAQSGTGTATFNFNPATGGTGYSDGSSFSGFAGNWDIGTNVLVVNYRNGATAWGTGTINLSGGTIASTSGNWTWTNNISLGASTTSGVQLASGNDRWLKLQGVISGSGNLNIVASGSTQGLADRGVILTNNNTMSGTVTIASNAFLRVGGIAGNTTADLNAGTAGTLGTAAVVNNGSLTFSRSDSLLVSNAISGTGIVNIGGTTGASSSIWNTGNDIGAASTQIITLSGTNTYTGGTQINAGRMNLTGSLTSAISVASVAKISGAGTTTGLLTMAAGSSIALPGGATTTSLTVNGVNFSGATTVTFDTPGLASTNYDVLNYGSGTVTNPGNLSVAWRGTLTNDTANKKFVFTSGSAAARTWSASSGTWDVYSSANFAEGDNKFISGDSVTFGEPASTSAVTLSGRLSPASVTVNNTSNAYTFTGADGTADITGSGSLTKSGAGGLTITTAQTYTGATSVNGGTLKFTGTGAIGSTSGISVASGAVFEWGRDAAVNRDFSGSGTITRSTTSGNAVFSGSNSAFTGAWTITSGYVGIANDGTVGASGVGMTWNGGGIFFTGTGNTLSSSRTVTLGASGGTLNGSTGNTNTFAANFTGAGNLNKVSGEKAILTAVNDFTGNISISGGGTLEIGGAGQFGNGSYAGAIAITGGNTFSVNTTAGQTLSGIISGAGSLTKGNTGALSLSSANTYTGSTTISGGKLALGTGASLYSTGSFFGNASTTNIVINSGGTLETRNWNYGAGNALNEMRANSYAILINGGTVRFTENTTAVRGFQVGANGATLEADSGVTYTKLAGDLSSDNLVQGVSGGSVTLGGAGNGEIQDGIGSHGTWSGSAGITKAGAGTWILSGNNTYAGITSVNAGSLRVNGTNSGAGAVNVAFGASLGGSGSVAGSVNVSGVLAPGNSIESFGTGALSFATGSSFAYELNSSLLDGDLVDSAGTLDIASGTILTLTDLAAGTLANGSKLTLISYFGGWVNTELFTYLGDTLADDSVITLGSNQWVFNYNDTSGGSNFAADQTGATGFVTMTVVPEPAAALLGGLGLLTLLRRRRIEARL